MSRSDRRTRRGAGVLEFAIALPVLLAFVLAIADLARFVLDLNRLAAAAAAAADLGAQVERFTPEMDPNAVTTGREVSVLALAARESARPMDLLDGGGAVIVTSVANVNGSVGVAWQRRWGRADIAARGGAGALGLRLAAGEAALYAEAGYRFRPFILSGRILGLTNNEAIVATAVRRPRLSGPTIQ